MKLQIYPLIRPILFRIPPETIHNIIETIGKIYARTLPLHFLIRRFFAFENIKLEQTYNGIKFSNPIGIAGGFDKNATMVPLLSSLGFGFLEVGTVTPKAQQGNPKPRLFRFPKEKALLNRMGFNNEGMEAMAAHLDRYTLSVPIGINIGKNKNTPIEAAFEDYQKGIHCLWDKASYFTLNISSPNTANLRTLQQENTLASFLSPILDYYYSLAKEKNETKPIWIKIAPDMDQKTASVMLDILVSYPIQGIIISNTTTDYSLIPSLAKGNQSGGISGKPLLSPSNQLLRLAYQHTQGKMLLIASGGIFNAQDVFDKLALGANLVQIYTGLIYQGAGVVKDIKKELLAILEKKGYAHISQVIGSHYHN